MCIFILLLRGKEIPSPRTADLLLGEGVKFKVRSCTSEPSVPLSMSVFMRIGNCSPSGGDMILATHRSALYCHNLYLFLLENSINSKTNYYLRALLLWMRLQYVYKLQK